MIRNRSRASGRGAGVVERGGLENHCRLAYRGFESLPLRSMVKSSALALLSFLLISSLAWGQEIYYEPVIRPLGTSYLVYKSEHFEIIFEEGSEVEAWQTALTLERALSRAQALSGPARPMSMPVVLNNFSDQSNGYLHTHPFRQEIEIPHIKGSRLGTKFDSWITAVATHELVHATQAEADGPWGIGKLLRRFAPDAARALNLSLPPGLNEGAAVFFESSELYGAGRLNDPRFQMQFIAAAESGRPWSLSQLLESPRYSFHANRHYLGGANFFAWHYARDQGSFFKQMRTRRYRIPLRSTGRDLQAVTGESLDELIETFRRETARERVSISDSSDIIAGHPSVLQRWPQWLNDSTLVLYRRGVNETSGIYSLDIERGIIQLIHAVRLPEDAWFSVKDSTLLYSRYTPDRFSQRGTVADVFKYDLRNEREERLTRGARAHMPVQTSSGIWALQNDGQRNIWIQIDADGQVHEIRGRSQADLIQVAPSEEIVALLVRHGGRQGIYQAQSDGELKPWIFLKNGAIRELSWSHDGRYLLFTADGESETNVYCHDLEQSLTTKLTEVQYGALDPILSRDQQLLFYIDYQHERYNLVATPFSPETTSPVALTPVQEIPDILPKLVIPENFTARPYDLISRLKPRMLLPVGSWSSETLERQLGLRGGLGIYGSDPLGRMTYRAEATIQSNKLWGRTEVNAVLGPVIGTIRAYHEPQAIVGRILTREQSIQDVTYGEQTLGIGISAMLPLRFEANVRHSFARIRVGVQSERTRWYSLGETPVPFRVETGESLTRWEPSLSTVSGISVAVGLQQNQRDLWPNRGTVIEAYTRTDLLRKNDRRQNGLLMRVHQYWSFSRRSNTGARLGVSFLTQNSGGVYSSSLVLPMGSESYLGRGRHARIDAEILQPLWYIEDGSLTLPIYVEVLYVYGFTQRVIVGKEYRGAWSSGLGVGLKFRLLHYIDMELRASFNPFDFNERYVSLE